MSTQDPALAAEMAGEDWAARAASVPLLRLARFAVDSDRLESLFAADFVRTYADLVHTEAELTQLQQRFPDSAVELIDRGLGDPLGRATIQDVEPGALTAAQAAENIRANQARHIRWNVVYSDRSDLEEVNRACEGLHYYHWVAVPGSLVLPGYSQIQVRL
jgi:hypothetical protein